MSSIEKFIDHVADLYGDAKGLDRTQVDTIFAVAGIRAIISKYPSPFISHSQNWRNTYIDSCVAKTNGVNRYPV